jgi:uncharacterized protein
MLSQLKLVPLDQVYAVCRLDPTAAVPTWLARAEFISITRTSDELSIVCPEEFVPQDVRCQRGWRGFRIAGRIEFTAIGVLASLVRPLADAGISLFAIATFDTDYLLVKEDRWGDTADVLRSAGHVFLADSPNSQS